MSLPEFFPWVFAWPGTGGIRGAKEHALTLFHVPYKSEVQL